MAHRILNKLSWALGMAGATLLVTLTCGIEASAEAKETVLYNFACGTDGCGPQGSLVRDSAGNLYGTTAQGGDLSCSDGNGFGCGTVFELSPNPDGSWTESVLYAFKGGSDGALPFGGVTLDSAGDLYGTTGRGGVGRGGGYCSSGCGIAFKLTHSNNGWTESVLYSFLAYPDGNSPQAGLVFDKAGNLYGTTQQGGSGCPNQGCGAVFELSPSGGGWSESILYSFNDFPDGGFPVGKLAFDSAGNLYGATHQGGVYYCPQIFDGCGTAFMLTPSAVGWTKRTIWNFTGGDDGAQPNGVIIHNSALYGTTSSGGGFHVGTVFELERAIGNATLHVVHTFTGGNDGGIPGANLLAGNFAIYGTTQFGGHDQFGTVFQLLPTENGDWKEAVLYNFTGGSDGSYPTSPLIFSSKSLVGTSFNPGSGLVYQISGN
jgi:uncharacterized repeat protein (TIGR03803 family)